ncbi:MAG: 16S rRNA (adenine(1518)-N(6)/adenine(1519)-N(6))-dimethyltransferase RsmA [Microbacteriaceae bacterium]
MTKLLGAADIRQLAEEMGVTPTKKLGQNFVVDGNTVRKIVKSANLVAGDIVLEVGPGLGSLTLGILEAGHEVLAVEIDSRLAERLAETASKFQPEATEHERLTVIHQDALQLRELPKAPQALVANLPYNVSVPVLLHLLEHFPSLNKGLVMVQAEVGYRLAAGPGSKIYGAPSLKAAWYGHWEIAGKVSRQIFWPIPNVDSVLVRFSSDERPDSEEMRQQTFRIIDAAFGQRRKTLRQALATLYGSPTAAAEAVEAAGIVSSARGEELVLSQFLDLARNSSF